MLQVTKCDIYCEFSTITSFCFDCPALMCQTCKILMHRSLDNDNHKIIYFDNKNMDWNCKATISNLFTDKVMLENIFTEVSRTFLEEIIDDNAWICTTCSTNNPAKFTRCHICHRIPIGKINISGYETKLNHVNKKLFPINSEFASMANIPFENVLYRYLRFENIKKISILDWFKNVYLNDKHLFIINEVIAKLGDHVEEDRLMTHYYECIQLKNKEISSIYPNKKMLPLNSKTLITCYDINKSNTLGNEFLESESTNNGIWKLICKSCKYTEHENRVLMTELNIDDYEKVVLLQDFIEDVEMGTYLQESFSDRTQLIHIRQALLDYFLIEDALKFLKKNCEYCFSDFPMPEMIVLITCNHQLCKTCAFGWLNEAIRNKFPHQWFCTLCSESENEDIDKSLYYYNLREILADEKELRDILETKLFQQQSMTNPNFHWCPNDNCGFGFEVVHGEVLKIQCNICKSFLCINCNRMWNEQHKDKTCHEYKLWLMKEDPSLLSIIGIECPKCRMRYSLAAGGCLHFICVTCGVEFCGGCSELFVKFCGNSQCTMESLHAHHPRNCLYHLRDYDIKILESMLQGHEYNHLDSKINTVCQVIICDKEYKESECNEPVYLTTGLCLKHYKEYLVEFINHFQIDPVNFCDSEKINQMLFQLLLPQLVKRNEEDDDQFKFRLTKEVKEKCKFYIPSSIEKKHN